MGVIILTGLLVGMVLIHILSHPVPYTNGEWEDEMMKYYDPEKWKRFCDKYENNKKS